MISTAAETRERKDVIQKTIEVESTYGLFALNKVRPFLRSLSLTY